MKQAALANGAYIALASSDPVVAFEYSKQLLAMKTSDQYR